MRGSGVEHVYLETKNWGATAAFWQRLGFVIEFETDHHSGSLRHPNGGPRLFVSERIDREPTTHLCVGIADSADASLDTFDVDQPWTAQHWDVMEALVRDPDGRTVSLQAPLSGNIEVDHHDYYWLGARPTLQVSDVAANLAVLSDDLGWNVFVTMGDPPEFAMVGVGNASLALTYSPAPAIATDIASVYIDVDRVDGLHRHCVDRSLDVTEPTTHPWGQRDFVLRLPSGHLLAFGEHVALGTAPS